MLLIVRVIITCALAVASQAASAESAMPGIAHDFSLRAGFEHGPQGTACMPLRLMRRHASAPVLPVHVDGSTCQQMAYMDRVVAQTELKQPRAASPALPVSAPTLYGLILAALSMMMLTLSRPIT